MYYEINVKKYWRKEQAADFQYIKIVKLFNEKNNLKSNKIFLFETAYEDNFYARKKV